MASYLLRDPFASAARAGLDEGAVQRWAAEIDDLSRDAFSDLARRLDGDGLEETSRILRSWAERIEGPREGGPVVSPQPPGPAQIPNQMRLDELARSRLTSPYRLWCFLVEHEMAQFAFWSYASAYASSGARLMVEEMARAALARAQEARRHRRQAFHAERASAPAELEPAAAAELAAERHLRTAERAGDDSTLAAAQAKSEEAIRLLERTVSQTAADGAAWTRALR
jgi:hypothetical protein